MFYIGMTLQEDLRVAVLKKSGGRVSVESLHTLPAGDVKQFYNLPPFHTKKPIHTVSGLEGEQLFIRKLHLPLKERTKILKVLPFQLESLLPFSQEDPIVCTQIKTLSKQMSSVTVFATTQAQLRSHLEALSVDVDVVSCAPMAFLRFTRQFFPQERKIICFHSTQNGVSCSVVEEGELLLSQTLHPHQNINVFEQFSLFLAQKEMLDPHTPWLLTGDVEKSAEIAPFFSGAQLEVKDPAFALAIGLALDAAAQDASCIQFCQQQLTPVAAFKKIKRGVALYAAACVGAALCMTLFGSLVLTRQEKILRGQLLSYYPSAHTASLNEMQRSIGAWENSYKGKKPPFALTANVPKVSDLLSYLSTHPTLSSEGVEIQSVHYSLMKYPKIGESNVPYAAKVELSLTSKTPRAARDFHEALLKGDGVVNEKKEIKWNSQKESYTTAFELQRKEGG